MATTFLSPIAEHLWQSTLFALAAALVAFALRKNRAQVRYCVWLAASMKFVIPFSLFVALGRHIQWTSSARTTMSIAVQQITQPLDAMPVFFPAQPQPATPDWRFIPIILLAIWLFGFCAVLLRWSKRWLQVRAAVSSAVPLSLDSPIPALSLEALLEPGVFGIFRPVLLLPAGITSHLTRTHLQAILAHELCHVRRRDNLAAAGHMLVEALFWFHPLVWWIGARLIEERERACDEEVLSLGNPPNIYAESILKTCQFYLESPLECVSGVTGSDLKKRIMRIMTGEAMSRLNIRQKVLLALAAAAVVVLPLAGGWAQTPQPSFEVASVKPSKPGQNGVMLRIKPGAQFTASNVTLKMLMEEAYDVKDSQLSGAPPWFDSEHYDIDAKPEDSLGAALDKLAPDERNQQMMKMIRSLLEDRFKLTLKHETKDLPIYALTVARSGSKLKPSAFKPSDKPANLPPPGQGGAPPPGGIWINGPGKLTSTGINLKVFATVLSRAGDLGRVVVDKTGLEGLYDFTLQWTPDSTGPAASGQGTAGEPAPESSNASLFTAIQEQLGLKLEAQKAPMPFLVIQHVEKPSEN